MEAVPSKANCLPCAFLWSWSPSAIAAESSQASAFQPPTSAGYGTSSHNSRPFSVNPTTRRHLPTTNSLVRPPRLLTRSTSNQRSSLSSFQAHQLSSPPHLRASASRGFLVVAMAGGHNVQVAVVGGGLGGLAAAIGAKKAGIADVTVFDRADSYGTEGGAGLALQPNAFRALTYLDEGIVRKILDSAVRIDFFNMNRGGMALRFPADMEMKYGFPFSCIEWAKLHSILYDAAVEAGVNFKLGSRVEGVESFDSDRPEVVLADGSRHSADFIVGADGLWSRVRGSMFGDTLPISLGRTLWRAVLPRSCGMPEPDVVGGASLVDDTYMAVGQDPTITTTFMPTSKDTYYWAFGKITGETEPPPRRTFNRMGDRDVAHEESKERLLQVLDALPQYKAIVEKTPAKYIIERPACYRPPLSKGWSKGRVLLIGDAAHAMPATGQGGCQAFEDAAQFFASFNAALSAYPSDLKEAVTVGIKSFEKARINRVEIIHEETIISSAGAYGAGMAPKPAASKYPILAAREQYSKWLMEYSPVETLDTPYTVPEVSAPEPVASA